MNFTEFKNSLSKESPPSALSSLLLALWYDGKGDWEKSHNIIQDINTKEAARIHAYLHRKEGDSWNADYWYNRAGEKKESIPLENEWQNLVNRFL